MDFGPSLGQSRADGRSILYALTAQARSKTAQRGPQFQIARFLIVLVYGLLPLVVSVAGLDKFRTPKDIVITSVIPLLAVICLASSSFRMRLGGFECVVLGAAAYVLIHGFFLGGMEAAVTVCLFALWLLLLSRLLSWKFQKRVWLVAGLSLSFNSVANVLQYFGKFPWMLREGGKAISGRLTPAGFLGEVGSGAILFGLIVLVSVYFLLFERNQRLRVAWLFIFLCNLTGLLFTRTITASLALSGCLVLWLGFHHWWVFKRHPQSLRGLGALWIVLLLAVGLSAALAVQSKLWDRVSRATRQVMSGSLEVATGGRYAVYLITWDMIKDRPLAGHGLTSFAPVFYHYRTETRYGQEMGLLPQAGAFREAHNEYLQTWAELGLPGVLLLAGLLGFSLFSAVRRSFREADPQQCYWSGILALSLIYFLVGSLTMFSFHVSSSAIFITLILGSIRHLDQYGFKENGTGSGGGRPRGLLAGLGLVLTLPLLYGQYQKWQTNISLGMTAFLLEGSNRQNLNARQLRSVAARALALLEHAESGYAGFPELHNLRGSAAMFLGRYQQAETSYRKAVERIPSPETMTNLAAALIAQNDCEKAEPYLDSALRYNRMYREAVTARRYCRRQGQ